MPSPMKDPSQRRRYNQPVRGEWVDLEWLEKPILPEHKRGWTIPKYMWDLWRWDPVTSQWTKADLAQAMELAINYTGFQHAERRLIKTSLGLNAKGRRDLRWRSPVETESAEKAVEKTAAIRRLRVVGAEHTKSED